MTANIKITLCVKVSTLRRDDKSNKQTNKQSTNYDSPSFGVQNDQKS